MIRVGLLGASGRMGQWVTQLLEGDFKDRACVGAKAGSGDPLEPLLDADVVIDFSSPAAGVALAKLALQKPGKIPVFVVGSTGWSPDQRRVLEELAQRTWVLASANFSIGVHVLLQALRDVAPRLLAMGYQASVIETHHTHKKDAPSGTALAIQGVIQEARATPVPIQSLREGEVVGDHEVTFLGQADRLVLSHSAQERSIFARGAIEVALWLVRRPQGANAPGQVLGLDAFLQ
jgi:4-hydroxy-tetrahydrodipicolinate reductase